MNTLDAVFLFILGVSVVWAFWKGFFKECLGLVTLVAGLILAARLYSAMAPFFRPWVQNPALRSLAGFMAVFFGVLVAGGLTVFLTDRILKWSQLKWADRLLGGIFGLVRGWLVCTVLVLGMTAFAWRVPLIERSVLAPYLLLTARVAVYATPREMRRSFEVQFRQIYQRWVDLLPDYRSGEPAAGGKK